MNQVLIHKSHLFILFDWLKAKVRRTRSIVRLTMCVIADSWIQLIYFRVGFEVEYTPKFDDVKVQGNAGWFGGTESQLVQLWYFKIFSCYRLVYWVTDWCQFLEKFTRLRTNHHAILFLAEIFHVPILRTGGVLYRRRTILFVNRWRFLVEGRFVKSELRCTLIKAKIKLSDLPCRVVSDKKFSFPVLSWNLCRPVQNDKIMFVSMSRLQSSGGIIW